MNIINQSDSSTIIIHGTLITPFKFLRDRYIVINKGKIETIIERKEDLSTTFKAEVIEARDKYIVPGFIDIHVHGGGGADVMDGEYESIKKIARTHSRFGTTAFLPTTMTMCEEKIIQSLRSIAEARLKGTGAAEILGAHLEGPYISKEKKGSQKEEDIKKCSKKEFLEFNKASGNLIRLVSLAPEIPRTIDFIHWLYKNNIIASAGHTNATYQQMQEAIKAGLTHITHLFNAMRGLHHREPGVVGAALTDPQLTVELIADGIHLNPVILKMVTQIKEKEKIILITDAMRAAGLGEGYYDLGGQQVFVNLGEARLQDGTLAGSILTMDKAVHNMVNIAGVTLLEAVQMASYNPAKLLGVDDKKGTLEQGKDADLVILNKNLETELTMVSGKIVYRRENE